MIKIPSTNQWTQKNLSDKFGDINNPNDIYSSFNLDLQENEGKVRIGKRLLISASTSDIAELNSYPVGFRADYSSTKLYTIAGLNNVGYVFKSTIGSSPLSFAKVVASGSPTGLDSTTCDIESAFQCTYISSFSDGKIYKIDAGGTFSSFTLNALHSTFPLMLCAYGDRVYTTYYRNNILSWSSSDTPNVLGDQYSLTLPPNQKIIWIRAASDRLWVGTIGDAGVKGNVYEWDGSSNQASKVHRLDTAGALACVVKDDIPYIIDANGKLIAWNGGTFKTIGQLFRRKNKVLYGNCNDYNDRFIHPNGMSVINGKINILINGSNFDSTRTQEETIPSGIWEYDENKGLYHKHSFGLTKSSDTIKDYGQTRIIGVGALTEFIPQILTSNNGSLLAGATIYTNATSTISGIFYNDLNDTLQKAGKFITEKIYSPNVMETFQSLYYRYKKLNSQGDKIVIKYRTEDQDPVEATITWTSKNTFFTTTDVSSYWTSGIGGEVDIVQGFGANICSHIISIVLDSGVYTVTVDEDYTGATGTSIARFQNWTKHGSNIYGDSHPAFNNLQFPLLATATWVQIKVWMLFTGRQEIDDLQLQTKGSQTANK